MAATQTWNVLVALYLARAALGATGSSPFALEMPSDGVNIAVWAVGISPPYFWHVLLGFHHELPQL